MYIIIHSLFLLLIFVGCQNKENIVVEQTTEEITSFSGEAMTMQYRILIGNVLNNREIKAVKELISSTFSQVNEIHNKWNPESELSQLNRMKANIKVAISPDLDRLFAETKTVVELSEGKFDPTIEPLQRLWKSKLQKEEIPSEEELMDIIPTIGWHHIYCENGYFYKDHDRTELDFGGIAKGLAIDLLAERLEQLNFHNFFVEWGGEIRAAGLHPEQRPWKVYISRLGDEDPEHAIDVIALNNQAIATSGDYLQNWSLWNKQSETYFHVFDSKTFCPLKITHTSIASVSIVANNCAFADGLATAAMLFSDCDSAKAWLKKIQETHPDIAFWVASRKTLNGQL